METQDPKMVKLEYLSDWSCFWIQFPVDILTGKYENATLSSQQAGDYTHVIFFSKITECVVIASFSREGMLWRWVLTLHWTGKNAPVVRNAWKSAAQGSLKSKMANLFLWMQKNALVVRVVLMFVNKMRFPLRKPGFRCRISAWPSCVIFFEQFRSKIRWDRTRKNCSLRGRSGAEYPILFCLIIGAKY